MGGPSASLPVPGLGRDNNCLTASALVVRRTAAKRFDAEHAVRDYQGRKVLQLVLRLDPNADLFRKDKRFLLEKQRSAVLRDRVSRRDRREVAGHEDVHTIQTTNEAVADRIGRPLLPNERLLRE